MSVPGLFSSYVLRVWPEQTKSRLPSALERASEEGIRRLRSQDSGEEAWQARNWEVRAVTASGNGMCPTLAAWLASARPRRPELWARAETHDSGSYHSSLTQDPLQH